MLNIGDGRGRFITFEGGEGTGKSTQVRHLSTSLQMAGFDVLTTREPGGSPGAEAIRSLLVTGEVDRWDATSEALLHFAARREHLRQSIVPALDTGQWVICDRFYDSTMAYQGYGHLMRRDTIEGLCRLVVADNMPDLTIILDLPVVDGLRRASASAGIEDRYERMDGDFHERVRDGFLDIAQREPERVVIIDAGPAPEIVAATIRGTLAKHFDMLLK
jgi:dTMP kinase